MSKGRILVVDDTATFREMLGDMLTQKGYEVIYAAEGIEAVKIVKEEMPKIDLVLLDLLMPKMLGFDVLKNIRHMEGGWDVPVIVITGLFKSIDDIRRVRELGAVGFIDKSHSMEEIVSRVDDFLHPQWEDKTEQQVSAQLLITYKVGEKPYSAYTHTLGPNGMYLRTSNVAPPGGEVKARFRLEEEGETIVVGGKVDFIVAGSETAGHRNLPPGIGIEFTEISPAHKALIEKWVKEKSNTFKVAPQNQQPADK